jgi:hypothetical protein
VNHPQAITRWVASNASLPSTEAIFSLINDVLWLCLPIRSNSHAASAAIIDCDDSNVNLAGSPHRPMRTWLWSPRKARKRTLTDVLCCSQIQARVRVQARVRAASSSILGDGERTGLHCSRQMLHSRTLTRPRTCVWENHHGAQWHDPNYTDTAMPWELKSAHADHPSCRAMWCRHRPLAQSLPSASASGHVGAPSQGSMPSRWGRFWKKRAQPCCSFVVRLIYLR